MSRLALVPQAAEQGLGQVFIAEHALPLVVLKVRSDKRGFEVVAFFSQFERKYRLFRTQKRLQAWPFTANNSRGLAFRSSRNLAFTLSHNSRACRLASARSNRCAVRASWPAASCRSTASSLRWRTHY